LKINFDIARDGDAAMFVRIAILRAKMRIRIAHEREEQREPPELAGSSFLDDEKSAIPPETESDRLWRLAG